MEPGKKPHIPEKLKNLCRPGTLKKAFNPEKFRNFSLTETLRKAELRDVIRWSLSGVFLTVAVCALILLLHGLHSDRKARETYASLQELMSGMETEPWESAEEIPSLEQSVREPETQSAEDAPEEKETEALMSSAAEAAAAEAAETYRQESAERTILPQFEALVAKNSDICGWIYIPGADISYPVVWTPDDPEYYLRRDIYGDYSRSGTPFVGKGCTVDSDLLLIYGHNMVNGTMFSNLSYYADKSFWQKNQTFNFNTIYEYREYTVFAAVDCRLSENEAEGFEYYQYSGDMTEEQFTKLRSWLQSHAAYDTGTAPQYGDQVLIVSTCGKNYSDERFLIAAYRTPDA